MKKSIYSRNHQERFGVEKRTKNASSDTFFAGIAPLDVLRRSQDYQLELYKTGDLQLMQEFFEAGGCFLQKVQRQIIVDDNIKVLDLFLDFWEFIPSERRYMIKEASLTFIDHYLAVKSLGRQSEEFARNARFSKEFVARHAYKLNMRAKEICRGFRKIKVY